MRFIWIVLLPFALWSQEIQPPLDFHKGPLMKVDPKIQNEWMDGPKALNKKAKSYQRIAVERQFPLWETLLVFSVIILGIVLFIFRLSILEWLRKKSVTSLSAKETALKKLQEVDQYKNWNDRYSFLGLIVREVLEKKYHFNAAESTYQEVLQEMSRQKAPETKTLKKLFEEMEAAVYRSEEPTEADYRRLKASVQELF